MKLSSLFGGNKHDEFARNLAMDFVNSLPPDFTNNLSNRKINQKYRKTINKINAKASEYGSSVKLGIYSKAKIGNTFMWILKEEGYDRELVESITNDLLHSLSTKRK